MKSLLRYIGLLFFLFAAHLHAETTVELLEEHGAEYLLKSYHCVVSGNNANLTVKRHIKIYNKRGEHYANVRLSESPYRELKNVIIRTKDSTGNVISERKKKDFRKACGYDNVSIYDDDCTYYTNAKCSSFPYTLEIEYEYHIKSLFFWRGRNFQSYIPVLKARYTLEIDNRIPFSYTATGGDLTPEVTDLGHATRYVWSVNNLVPLDDSKYIPKSHLIPIGVDFFPKKFKLQNYEFIGSEWKQIGEWYTDLYSDRMLSSKQPSTFPDIDNAMSFTEAVYNEVRESIRYVSISIGIGGWQPHKADKTLEWGYGDCKDMSNLLFSRLSQRGITAYPILLLTRDEGLTDTTFPSISFNHVITAAVIGTDTIWMDPTCDDCPFGQIPYSDQNIPVLAMTDYGGEIWRSPPSTWMENTIHRNTTWELDSTLNATIKCELKASGLFARSIRSAVDGMSNDELRQYVDRWFKGATKQFGITNYEFQNKDRLNEPMIIRITGKTSKAARKIGKTYYFNPFILNSLNSAERTDLTDRTLPLNLYYPDFETDKITVVWDKLIPIDSVSIPKNDSLDYSFGFCAVSGERFAASATFLSQKARYDYTLEPEKFDDLNEYRSKVKKLYKKHLKLVVQ